MDGAGGGQRRRRWAGEGRKEKKKSILLPTVRSGWRRSSWRWRRSGRSTCHQSVAERGGGGYVMAKEGGRGKETQSTRVRLSRRPWVVSRYGRMQRCIVLRRTACACTENLLRACGERRLRLVCVHARARTECSSPGAFSVRLPFPPKSGRVFVLAQSSDKTFYDALSRFLPINLVDRRLSCTHPIAFPSKSADACSVHLSLLWIGPAMHIRALIPAICSMGP